MRKSKWIIVIAIIVVAFMGVGFYSFNDVSIEGTFEIEKENIVEKNGEYYLLIDERELVLPKNFYEKIDFDKHNEYKINYVYNRLKNNDGEVVGLRRYGEQPWGN
ncbi:hypothetical protein [Lysinibacillus endophyticus]|uniref:hypothetical protein n=1 Tax=Ureibacillus endophyticus TaxID=1978490 RepID=UPI0020A0791A|nr:hypothetical protein [Lysinibacillus endophyticus]MCP1144762.1 hypothetical protein [Lysinibacillus endophyticus]